MKIHPFAERFPMLPEDQLKDLAADIAEHGQVYPIMTDVEGVLLDGRNRLAACKLVGVEPRVEIWKGDDPVAYILSVNVHRRHIPKGAQAMAMAIARPEPLTAVERGAKGGRGNKSSFIKKELNAADESVSATMLSQARTVIREFGINSETVKRVMQGESLADWYEKALEQKRLNEEWARKLEEFKAQLATNTASLTVLGEVETPIADFAEAMSKMPSVSDRLDVLDQQQRLLGTLQKLHEQIEAIAQQPIIEGWMQEAFVSAIYSGINTGILAFRQIAESYKVTLTRPAIKRVK